MWNSAMKKAVDSPRHVIYTATIAAIFFMKFRPMFESESELL